MASVPVRDHDAPKLRERAYARFTEKPDRARYQAGQFVSQRELVELTGLRWAQSAN